MKTQRNTRTRSFRATVLAAAMVPLVLSAGPDPVWQNLSSKRGDLPAPPGGSTQQTGAVVADRNV